MLAEQFGRSVAVIERTVNEGRAHRILEQKLEFVDHPSFADPAVAAVILAPMPASGAKSASRS